MSPLTPELAWMCSVHSTRKPIQEPIYIGPYDNHYQIKSPRPSAPRVIYLPATHIKKCTACRDDEQYKLDDPKRLVPLALFASVPVLSRELYIVNEETLLMGCFFLFLGACMDFGGASIAQYFDDRVCCTHKKRA